MVDHADRPWQPNSVGFLSSHPRLPGPLSSTTVSVSEPRLPSGRCFCKERALSNRAIAVHLGFSEKAIRKRLRRLGWKPLPALCLPFEAKTDDALLPARVPFAQIGATA